MRETVLVALMVLIPRFTWAQQTVVAAENAPIYLSAPPAAGHRPLRVAAKGTTLRVISQDGDWLQVQFQDPQWGPRTGWVEARLMTNPDSASLAPMDLSVPAASGATPAVTPARDARFLKSCVIVKIYQKKAADAWTRWTVPKPYNYVEGEFPAGLRFRSELNDKHVAAIKERGGQVVVLRPDYELPDLEDARRTCAAWGTRER